MVRRSDSLFRRAWPGSPLHPHLDVTTTPFAEVVRCRAAHAEDIRQRAAERLRGSTTCAGLACKSLPRKAAEVVTGLAELPTEALLALHVLFKLFRFPDGCVHPRLGQLRAREEQVHVEGRRFTLHAQPHRLAARHCRASPTFPRGRSPSRLHLSRRDCIRTNGPRRTRRWR